MARVSTETVTAKIFENILFLAEDFGDYMDKDIPEVPVLELARCFELSRPPTSAGH
jgi:hypothetical protein